MGGITIVCFLWEGDRWTWSKLGQRYVDVLYNMVERNLSTPFRFVCFCDRKLLVRSEIDQHIFGLKNSLSWKGCLPRLYMYSHEAGLTGQVLALDLDVVVVGSLDAIASYRGDFCVRSKFKPGMEDRADGDIIGFNADKCRGHWHNFAVNPRRVEADTGGRERWYYRKVDECKDRWQTLYPGQVLSYKRHVRGHGLPAGAVIVSCHGKPRPHEIKEQWAEENWK